MSFGSRDILSKRPVVVPSPLCSTEGRWALAAMLTRNSPTLEQWRNHSSESTACTKHHPVTRESGELLKSSWFSALSELWVNSRTPFLHVLCTEIFSFWKAAPSDTGKGPAGSASWCVRLSECCHPHYVSRNATKAEPVNNLPPLLSPLIILY